MKNSEKLPVEIRDVKEFVLRPAANCEGETPYMYAQCDDQLWTSNDKGEKAKVPAMSVEAYTGPEDFCKQMTEGLRMLLDHDLINHRLMDSVKVTLVVEYVQTRPTPPYEPIA